MAKIIYRSTVPSATTTGSSTSKAFPLTNAEIDQNFYNLDAAITSVTSTASSTDTSGNTLVIRNAGSFSANTVTAKLIGNVVGDVLASDGTTVVLDNGSGSNATFTGSVTGNASSATKATNLAGGNSTTLLGSIGYQSNTDTTTLLGPNTTANKRFLTQTGTGTNGAIPSWAAILDADVPNLTGKTYNALTLTSNSIGFQIAGGTTSVTAVFGQSGSDVTFTGLASKATALATGRTISITGDLSYTSGSFDGTGTVTGTGTLATVNSSAGVPGSFGSSTAIPVLTVNAKGLVTAISTSSVSTTISLAGGSGTGSVAGGGTLTFTGSAGVSTSVSSSTVTFSPTSGYNGFGARTVEAISAGVPSNSTGADGDIRYQY